MEPEGSAIHAAGEIGDEVTVGRDSGVSREFARGEIIGRERETAQGRRRGRLGGLKLPAGEEGGDGQGGRAQGSYEQILVPGGDWGGCRWSGHVCGS